MPTRTKTENELHDVERQTRFMQDQIQNQALKMAKRSRRQLVSSREEKPCEACGKPMLVAPMQRARYHGACRTEARRLAIRHPENL